MKLMRTFAGVLGLSFLFAGALAQAATVTGTVTNMTTNKPATGDVVTLLEPMSGMSEVGHATTNAQGKYSLDLPGQVPYLVRVTHQGAEYFIAAPQGGGNGDISVYDVAAKVEGITIAEHVTGIETDNGQLRVVERYDIHNASSPPRTQWSKQSFQVILPEDAVVGDASAQRPGASSLPTSVKLNPDGPKGHYSFDFPIQPDQEAKGTLFQVQYNLPYSSGKYTFHSQVTLPADTIWVVLPKSMTFTGGSGAAFESSPQDPSVQTFLARNVAPGKTLEFSVAGTGSFARDDQNGQGDTGGQGAAPGNQPGGGIGEPINTPDPLSKYKWWILGGLALLLAAAAAFLLRKPATAGATSLKQRYEDAYAVARGIILLGTIIKYAAAAIGLIILIATISQSHEYGVVVVAGGIVTGTVFGLLGFATGVLISAQGQIMLAMIDTAVNTSPLVDRDEKAQMIGIDLSSRAPGVVTPGSIGHSKGNGTEMLGSLKEELFALESEKIAGTLSASEYAEQKAALETVLRRALKKS